MVPSNGGRDRNFEKALARQLRAGSRAEASSATPSCSDIEALAAYHEGLLPPEQASLWNKHIQGCPQCREILAHLQATDDTPLAIPHALDQRKTVGVPVLKPRKTAHWRWAAPAGALAAGLLVWVTVRENRPVEVDELPKAASSAPSTSRPPQAAAAKPPAPTRKTESANEKPGALAKSQETAARPTAATIGGILQEKRQTGKASATPAKPAMSAQEESAENSLRAYSSAPPQPEIRDRTDAAAKERKEKAPGLLPSSAASTPAPEPTPKISAMSETVTVESAGAVETENSAAGSVSDQVALEQKQDLPRSGRSYAALLALAKDAGAVTIAAPHSSTQWRIGAAGIIARSKDAGAHWTLQPSGVISDLLAGSASSKKICWIVGRAGTILRTTDGGAHWLKLPPPIVDDFASVFAVSARQATVSPAHGSYQTVDGGATWKKLAPE